MAPNVTAQTRQSFVKKPKNRQTKTQIIFDEKARREYLTGFRKRKAERRKKFNEKLKKDLKVERKRLQTELREKIKKSNRDVPEVAHLLDDPQATSDTYDLPEATVTISAITDSQFRDENVFLGNNTAQENEDTSEDEGKDESVVDRKKQSKTMNREAMKKLQKTKAFKKVVQLNKDRSRKKSKQKLKKRK